MNTIKYIQCRDTNNNLVTVNTAISSLYIDNDDNLKIETSDELGGNDINIVSKGDINLSITGNKSTAVPHAIQFKGDNGSTICSFSNKHSVIYSDKYTISGGSFVESSNYEKATVSNIIKSGIVASSIIVPSDSIGQFVCNGEQYEEFDPEVGPVPSIDHIVKCNSNLLHYFDSIFCVANRTNDQPYLASYSELRSKLQNVNEDLVFDLRSLNENSSIWVELIDSNNNFVKYIAFGKITKNPKVTLVNKLQEEQCDINDTLAVTKAFIDKDINDTVSKNITTNPNNDTIVNTYVKYRISEDSNVQPDNFDEAFTIIAISPEQRSFGENTLIRTVLYYFSILDFKKAGTISTELENALKKLDLLDFVWVRLGEEKTIEGSTIDQTYRYIKIQSLSAPSIRINSGNKFFATAYKGITLTTNEKASIVSKNTEVDTLYDTKIQSGGIIETSSNSFKIDSASSLTLQSGNALNLNSDNLVNIQSANSALNTNSTRINTKSLNIIAENNITFNKEQSENLEHNSYDILKVRYTNNANASIDSVTDDVDRYFDVPAFYEYQEEVNDGLGDNGIYAQCSVSDIIKLVAYMKNNHLGPWVA